ncbi:MAG: alpha-amylase family glycosyl hydrolase [Candidatus Sericytochromatia bacterium]|nr:alpha-amylase family glycosyl hydrolase [Candidatus Sericytochromatia bacterium]
MTLLDKWAPRVIYQVFPDRFSAWPTPSPSDRATQRLPWNGHPIQFSHRRSDLTHRHRHQFTLMGGNLEGIRQRLSHLEDLGIDALYLTPIFEARSSHRYDTDDYHNIDPLLGTREDLQRLKADLSQRGMLLILDGVLNHTSHYHPWLQSEPQYYLRTANGQPETWMGTGLLPKLNPENPGLQQALLSILDAWPEADAWRLDASHLIARKFLRRLRHHLGPQKLVIGEDWDDARYDLKEGIYDGHTNFAFQKHALALLQGDCSPETFIRRMSVVYEGYPWSAVCLSWNLLGNHDTDRVFSKVGERDAFLTYARLLQVTLPGTPLIYYGDEYGMPGWGDWGARGPMVWSPNKKQRKRYEELKKLLSLRKAHPVLVDGNINFLYASNQERTLVWERTKKGERILVGLNLGPNSVTWRDGGENFVIPAATGAIRDCKKNGQIFFPTP